MLNRSQCVLWISLSILSGLLLTQSGLTPLSSSNPTKTWTYTSGFDPHGGYLDRVTFVVYHSEDILLALQDLQAGIIYAYDDNIPPEYVLAEIEPEGPQVRTEPGDMYRLFVMNCEKFPTNITGYRRAIAYALDKGVLIQASTMGLAYLQDCALPIALGNWTYEHQLNETYYMSDIVKANTSLEAAGFRDLNGDGWRDYDTNNNYVWNPSIDLDSSAFAIPFYCQGANAPAENAIQLAVDSLAKCGILAFADPQYPDFYEWLVDPLDWWLWCFTSTNMDSADRLYDYFHSSTVMSQWFSGGWSNATYNQYAENLIAAQTMEEAYHWAWKCQEILWYEQPMIVCYNDVVNHAFRTDRWEGYVNMACRNRMGDNPWTLRSLRLTRWEGGPWGCYPTEYILSLTDGLDTTNILMSNSKYSDRVFSQIYSRLWLFDPFTWEPVPDIAHTWNIELTNSSGDIQDGAKYTFYLYENATWHDGTPLTATDVTNSVALAQLDSYNSENYENIYLTNILDNHTVEIYSNKTGYFEWTHSTDFTILPWHIWSQVENITEWEPASPLELTGSGPFQWGGRIPGQYIRLNLFTGYHLGVEQPPRTHCHNPVSLTLYGMIALGIIVIIVQVAILGYLLHRRSGRKSIKNSKQYISTQWRED